MGKFNTGNVKDRKYLKNTVKNKAGGYVYDISNEAKLAGFVFTSLVKDEFYRPQNKNKNNYNYNYNYSMQERVRDSFFNELKSLIEKCDPEFVAKVAWKARHIYGLRSISHLVAHLLYTTGGTSGVSWGSKFYESIVFRPDDITEILSLSDGKPSHAMRKGFANAMQLFDEYQLAKYAKFQKADGSINLNDVMRICHVPFEKGTNNPLEKLMYRTLRNTDTVEAKGNTTEGWIDLLTRKKLGYTALVKNLKNIINKGNDELTKLTCAALIDEKAVRNSKLLPMYFLTAYNKLHETFKNTSSIHARKIIEHLVRACDISVNNITPLKGKTLILIDQSGSMINIKDTAHLFACAFAHACEDYIVAAFSAATYRSNSSPMNYINSITDGSILKTALEMKFRDGGTDFVGTYNQLSKDNIKVDRIIQITDQQDWVNTTYSTTTSYIAFRKWCKHVGMDPEVWSIDIAGLGTSVFPEDKIRTIYGISEKIFDLIPAMEGDPKAFINSIHDVEFLNLKEQKNKKSFPIIKSEHGPDNTIKILKTKDDLDEFFEIEDIE